MIIKILMFNQIIIGLLLIRVMRKKERKKEREKEKRTQIGENLQEKTLNLAKLSE